MHCRQKKLEMLIRERKSSQEANCFPKCRFKRLSNGSAGPKSVSAVVQSTQGCSPTHLSVLQLPRLCPHGEPEQGIDLSGKKSVQTPSEKQHVFLSSQNHFSHLAGSTAAQTAEAGRDGGSGECGNQREPAGIRGNAGLEGEESAGFHRPWKGSSAEPPPRSGPLKGPRQRRILLPRSPPALSKDRRESWLLLGRDGCSDTRASRVIRIGLLL